MKKLSMLLSVVVCSIGLFQSAKGMDAPPQTKEQLEKEELFKKYLFEQHLLETSLTEDLVLFIRQLQVDIVEKERLEKQRILEATGGAVRRDVGATLMMGLWNVVNKVDWAKHAHAIGDFFDGQTNKFKDAQQKRFEAEMKANNEKQERLERQLADKSLSKDYRAMLMRQQEAAIQAAEDVQKRNQERQEQIEDMVFGTMQNGANMLGANMLMAQAGNAGDHDDANFVYQKANKLKDAQQKRFEAEMKANNEKQERLERQLADKSLSKDYRAMLMRQQEAAIQAAEDAQKRNQQRQEQLEKEELFKKYLLESFLLKGFLPEELVSFIIRLQAALEVQARWKKEMKANNEKQERLERQLADKSLSKDYRAMLIRQQEATIEAAEEAQRQLQALLQ